MSDTATAPSAVAPPTTLTAAWYQKGLIWVTTATATAPATATAATDDAASSSAKMLPLLPSTVQVLHVLQMAVPDNDNNYQPIQASSHEVSMAGEGDPATAVPMTLVRAKSTDMLLADMLLQALHHVRIYKRVQAVDAAGRHKKKIAPSPRKERRGRGGRGAARDAGQRTALEQQRQRLKKQQQHQQQNTVPAAATSVEADTAVAVDATAAEASEEPDIVVQPTEAAPGTEALSNAAPAVTDEIDAEDAEGPPEDPWLRLFRSMNSLRILVPILLRMLDHPDSQNAQLVIHGENLTNATLRPSAAATAAAKAPNQEHHEAQPSDDAPIVADAKQDDNNVDKPDPESIANNNKIAGKKGGKNQELKRLCWLLGDHVYDVCTKNQFERLRNALQAIYLDYLLVSQQDLNVSNPAWQTALEDAMRQCWMHYQAAAAKHTGAAEPSQAMVRTWVESNPYWTLTPEQQSLAQHLDAHFSLSGVTGGESNSNNSQQQQKRDAIQLVQDRVQATLAAAFPGSQVSIYGSCLTGLGNKDVDLSWILPEFELLRDQYRKGAIPIMQYQRGSRNYIYKIGRILEGKPDIYEQVEIVPRARIPVVRGMVKNAHADGSSLAFDICLSNDIAVVNSALLLEYTRVPDARAKRLMLTVKQWAADQHIGTSKDNTLSSYAWMNMVIFYLQCIGMLPNLQSSELMHKAGFARDLNDPRHHVQELETHFLTWEQASKVWQPPAGLEHVSMTTLLYGFFHFYAKAFPVAWALISIHKGGATPFMIPKTVFRACTFFLCLEDPFERADSYCPHDLGNTALGSDQGQHRILACLKQAESHLGQILNNLVEKSSSSSSSSSSSPETQTEWIQSITSLLPAPSEMPIKRRGKASKSAKEGGNREPGSRKPRGGIKRNNKGKAGGGSASDHKGETGEDDKGADADTEDESTKPTAALGEAPDSAAGGAPSKRNGRRRGTAAAKKRNSKNSGGGSENENEVEGGPIQGGGEATDLKASGRPGRNRKPRRPQAKTSTATTSEDGGQDGHDTDAGASTEGGGVSGKEAPAAAGVTKNRRGRGGGGRNRSNKKGGPAEPAVAFDADGYASAPEPTTPALTSTVTVDEEDDEGAKTAPSDNEGGGGGAAAAVDRRRARGDRRGRGGGRQGRGSRGGGRGSSRGAAAGGDDADAATGIQERGASGDVVTSGTGGEAGDGTATATPDQRRGPRGRGGRGGGTPAGRGRSGGGGGGGRGGGRRQGRMGRGAGVKGTGALSADTSGTGAAEVSSGEHAGTSGDQ